MTTGTDIFFSRLFELKLCLEITGICQKDFKSSSYLAIQEATSKLEKPISELVRGWAALYYSPKINVQRGEVVEPLIFSQNMYKILQESKIMFVDGWALTLIDEISKILALLIFRLKFTQ